MGERRENDMMQIVKWMLMLSLIGCAGTCQELRVGCSNEMGNTDWLIVQYPPNGGDPVCWTLEDKALGGGELATFWIDDSGHIVHLNVLHNVVEVSRGDFAGAAKALGVDLGACLVKP